MRRSLFTNESERAKFLNHLAGGTLELLRTQQGLADHANYHEFCRLLGRLKTNYQLSELVCRLADDMMAGGCLFDHCAETCPQLVMTLVCTRRLFTFVPAVCGPEQRVMPRAS